MKKIGILLLFCVPFLIGCSKKEVPAEVQLYNNLGEKEPLTIHATQDMQEIKQIFHQIDDGILAPYTFSTVHVDCSTDISGALSAELNGKTATMELDYNLHASTLLHFKSFRATGSIQLEGTNQMESVDFSSQQQHKIVCDFQNDDQWLYLNSAFLMGENKINMKGKMDAQGLQEYRLYIFSLPELLRNYKITYFLQDIDSFVEAYQVSIVATTKDSFVVRGLVPAAKLNESWTWDADCMVDITLSCDTLLPISIKISADEVIEKILENRYIEQWTTDQVTVSKAQMAFELQCSYGNETLDLWNEEEKATYSELDWNEVTATVKKYFPF